MPVGVPGERGKIAIGNKFSRGSREGGVQTPRIPSIANNSRILPPAVSAPSAAAFVDTGLRYLAEGSKFTRGISGRRRGES